MSKMSECIAFITEHYLQYNTIRYDAISNKLQIQVVPTSPSTGEAGVTLWREMNSIDINNIVCQCAQECQANITSSDVMTVLKSDLVPKVHPLRDYVESLKPYTPDQPDWIDMVARQVRVKPSGEEARGEELWRECFKRWFVAMVTSWMKDEVVNHTCLILVGRQGCYKSSFLESLIPPHLRGYSCKMPISSQLSKDERLRIAEFGMINLDELDCLSAREMSMLKSLMTATDVNERAAYAYTKERRMRLASFCGSTNNREFLSDLSGSRRWLPFEVESIQNPFHTTLPYDLMYAQAKYLAESGTFTYWFDSDEIAVLEQHNEEFRSRAGEEELLPILFDVPAEGKGEFMTSAQIREKLVSFGGIKKPMALNTLGILLSKAGYKTVRRRLGGSQVRGWLVYQRTSDEIYANQRLLI
jgi:predicted P-loop ATPase